MIDLLTLAAATADLPLGVTEVAAGSCATSWLIPLLPALSFVTILFFGKRMPRVDQNSALPLSESHSCCRS